MAVLGIDQAQPYVDDARALLEAPTLPGVDGPNPEERIALQREMRESGGVTGGPAQQRSIEIGLRKLGAGP